MRHALRLVAVAAVVLPVAAGAHAVTTVTDEFLAGDRGYGPAGANGAVIHLQPLPAQVRHSVGTNFRDVSDLVLTPDQATLYVLDYTANPAGYAAGVGAIYNVDIAGAHAEPAPLTSGGATQTLVSPIFPATNYFLSPTGIALEPSGMIVVADRDASPPGYGASTGAVIRVDPATGAQTIVSPISPMTSYLSDPTGLTVAPNGDIYVTDRFAPSGGGVIKVDPATGVQTVVAYTGSPVLPSPSPAVAGPWGIKLHPDGYLYFGDRESKALFKVLPTGGTVTRVFSGDVTKINFPEGLGIAQDGDVLVGDIGVGAGGTGWVARFDLSPAVVATTPWTAGNLVDPTGVAALRSSTLTSTVAGTTLSVASTADDAFTVACVNGQIRVNGFHPTSGAATCAGITTLSVTGGPGRNVIDLSWVTAATFPALTSVTVLGGGGADLIRGSRLADGLNGQGDNDTVEGGPGDDLLLDDSGQDTLDGQGGSDTYDVFFGSLGGPTVVSDTGPTSDLDALIAEGTAGADTITGTDFTVTRGGETITPTGIESRVIKGLGDNDLLDAVGSAVTPYGLFGGSGTDTLTGGAAGDLLDGEAGTDTLGGGGGSDFLLAGDGADTLDGGFGNDVYKVWMTAGAVGAADSGAGDKDYLKIFGSIGADTITVAPGVVTGGTMTTTFSGIEGEIVVYGDGDQSGTGYGFGPGDADVLDASTATKNVHLFGQKGNDTITGGPGNDGLNGGDGTDTLSSGGGNDTLDGGLGGDGLTGGAGSDTVSYTERTASVTVTADGAVANDGEAGEGDNVAADVEKLIGGSAADTLTGNALNNALTGGGGNDTLYGGAGNDTLVSDAGGDTLNGNSGTADVVSYSGRTSPVTVTGGDGLPNDGEFAGAEGDNVGNDVERIIGTPFADSLTGGSAANILYGLGGYDFLDGGSGNDTLDGGTGGDGLVGGLGTDTVSYATRLSAVWVNSGNGAPDDGEFFGGEGDNVGSDIEKIYGSPFGDVLAGSPFADTIYGGAGDDDITGASGADTLYGQAGFDVLHGFDGFVDKLYCGTEIDTAERDVAPADIVSLDCETLIP